MTPTIDFSLLRGRIVLSKIDLGVSRSQLAERADVSPSRLSKIANGKANPTYDELARFCVVFGCEINELIEVDTNGA